jgi:hypothetical protein
MSELHDIELIRWAAIANALEKIEAELYEMVNIYPADSGLPMTVWAGPRGNARHDVRVVAHRDGQISGVELGRRLQRLSPQG